MDTVRNVLMSYLVKLLAPESPAYGNTIPFVKQQSLEQIISTLQPCDIIFTKTNNSWYELCRRILNTEYDHVSVVINKNQVIHISPPIISKLDISCMINDSRQPTILRLDLDSAQRQHMLSILLNFIGEKYNESAIPEMFKNQLFSRIFASQKQYQFGFQTMKYSKICTEAILYAIGKAEGQWIQKLEEFINSSTTYYKLGFILPEDMLRFLLQNCEPQIIYKSSHPSPKTLVHKLQDNISQLTQKLSSLSTFLPSSQTMQIKKLQAYDTIKKLGSKTSKILLKQHPLIRILNVVFILFQLKYGAKFNKILLIYSVVATMLVFRVVPGEEAIRNVFRKLAKL